MTVLVDTGVLYAFLDKRDARHGDAVELVARLGAGQWGRAYVSDHIVGELLTLVRARSKNPRDERAARALLPLPESSLPGLGLLPVGPTHLAASVVAFERHRDRDLSFADASSLALMAAHEIGRLATFDKGFAGLVPIVA